MWRPRRRTRSTAATHCYLADPEYGEYMGKALGLNFDTVKKYSKLDREELAKSTE
jgi:catalase